MASDSDITSESLIHRFGYTAAIAAATQADPLRRGDAQRRGEPATGQPDHDDGGDAEQRHREALREHRVAAAEAPRRQVQRRQRPVLGAGLAGEGVLEPVALGVAARPGSSSRASR